MFRHPGACGASGAELPSSAFIFFPSTKAVINSGRSTAQDASDVLHAVHGPLCLGFRV